MPVISVKKVNKYFGDHHVLKNISFSINPGEVVCLLGPSGSGKSTCLRTLNALETIDSGEITFCGINYKETKMPWHQIRRKSSMVFQRFELFPHMSALENVALSGKLVLKLKAKEAILKAEILLEEVGLKDHKNKYPHQLSGGQQQRVGIARALMNSPEVLLCDEPTSALDPELVGEVTDILQKVAKKGMTMIVVTHELNFAKNVSDRCFFLESGEILEEGRTHDFFENPKSSRLKNFLSKVRH